MPQSLMETAQLRKQDVIAANLLRWGLILSMVIWVFRMFVLHTQEIAYNPWVYLVVIGVAVLYFRLYKAVARGEKWARIAVVVIFFLGLLGNLKILGVALRTIPQDPLNLVSQVIHYLTYIGAMVLLFNRPPAPAE